MHVIDVFVLWVFALKRFPFVSQNHSKLMQTHLLSKCDNFVLNNIYTHVCATLIKCREEVKEMINKKKTGSETLAAYEEHLNQVWHFET